MPIQMQTRSKQPYLVNPVNPWKRISVPKHTYAVWMDKKTHKFAKAPEWAAKTKASFMRKHHIPLGDTPHKVIHRKPAPKARKGKLTGAAKAAFLAKMNAGRKAAGLKKISAKGSYKAKVSVKRSKKSRKHYARLGMSKAAFKHTMKKFRKSSKAEQAMTKQLLHLGGFQLRNPIRRHKMSKRYKSRRSFFSNPFNVKGLAKDLIDKDMLIDTGIAGLGLMATNIAVQYAGNKVAFLSTPTGKTLGKLAMAVVFKQAGRAMGKNSIGKALAMGATLSAIQDIYEIVLPKLGYAGGVRLLGDGYMPDVSAGYMPDVQGGVSSGYMPDTALAEGSYGFSD